MEIHAVPFLMVREAAGLDMTPFYPGWDVVIPFFTCFFFFLLLLL